MKSPPPPRRKRRPPAGPVSPPAARNPPRARRAPVVPARRELAPLPPVRRVRPPPARLPARRTSPTTIFLGAAAAIAALACALGHHLGWPWVISALVAVNAATFLLYAYDKAIAGRQRLRVPERVLHGLALAGGTMAALLAQRLLRHKVSKYAFQRTFWLLALGQASALAVAWFTLARG